VPRDRNESFLVQSAESADLPPSKSWTYSNCRLGENNASCFELPHHCLPQPRIISQL
jgi:hypothetical protein